VDSATDVLARVRQHRGVYITVHRSETNLYAKSINDRAVK